MGEPDPQTEGAFDGYGPFAEDDDDRIAGLDVEFEPPMPPKWVRKLWATDAKYDPLPPGAGGDSGD